MFPVFHLVCGESDGLVNAAKKFHEELTAAGIKHTFKTGPGDHSMKADWPMLREFLREFTRPRS
jgi:enterochelin esterase-like enzyme